MRADRARARPLLPHAQRARRRAAPRSQRPHRGPLLGAPLLDGHGCRAAVTVVTVVAAAFAFAFAAAIAASPAASPAATQLPDLDVVKAVQRHESHATRATATKCFSAPTQRRLGRAPQARQIA